MLPELPQGDSPIAQRKNMVRLDAKYVVETRNCLVMSSELEKANAPVVERLDVAGSGRKNPIELHKRFFIASHRS